MESERSQDKKIVMIGVRKGSQEGRCGTKRRNKEKSTTQKENHSTYTIVSLAGPNAVKLKLPRSLQIHSIVNMSQIKPYHGSMEGQNPHQPRPVNMTKDWDNKWEVDHIVDSHLKNKKT